MIDRAGAISLTRSAALRKCVSCREQIKMLRELSPLGAVTKDTAPTLIIHGDADQAVPYEQSERFVAKLAEQKIPRQLVTRMKAGHSWPDVGKDDVLRADWFDKHLQRKVEKHNGSLNEQRAE